MRIEGTLAKWSNDRGYGFIAPAQGGPDVFVHISAFPHDGIRPSLGERLSFEIEVDADGKKRAARLQRFRRVAVRPPARAVAPQGRAGSGLLEKFIVSMIVLGLAYFGYAEFTRFRTPQQLVAEPPAASIESSRFRCDGRTRCPEMRSCEEATYFLRHCPGVKMDGNRDGVPCEEQWCGGSAR